MNSILKYLIFFILGIILSLFLKMDKVEGFIFNELGAAAGSPSSPTERSLSSSGTRSLTCNSSGAPIKCSPTQTMFETHWFESRIGNLRRQELAGFTIIPDYLCGGKLWSGNAYTGMDGPQVQARRHDRGLLPLVDRGANDSIFTYDTISTDSIFDKLPEAIEACKYDTECKAIQYRHFYPGPAGSGASRQGLAYTLFDSSHISDARTCEKMTVRNDPVDHYSQYNYFIIKGGIHDICGDHHIMGTGANGVGAADVCEMCPRGKERPHGQEECTVCRPGTYSASGACKSCPVNQWTNSSGSINCNALPDNSVVRNSDVFIENTWAPPRMSGINYNYDTGQGPNLETLNLADGSQMGGFEGLFWPTGIDFTCDDGFRKSETSPSQCTQCEVGTFGTDGTCTSCPVGQFQDQIGQSSCNDCPVGQYQDTVGASGCSSCVEGKFQDTVGGASCNNCVAGTDSLPWASNCFKCPPGTTSVSGGRCESCPAEQYQPESGKPICIPIDADAGQIVQLNEDGFPANYKCDTDNHFNNETPVNEELSSNVLLCADTLCKLSDEDEGKYVITNALNDSGRISELSYKDFKPTLECNTGEGEYDESGFQGSPTVKPCDIKNGRISLSDPLGGSGGDMLLSGCYSNVDVNIANGICGGYAGGGGGANFDLTDRCNEIGKTVLEQKKCRGIECVNLNHCCSSDVPDDTLNLFNSVYYNEETTYDIPTGDTGWSTINLKPSVVDAFKTTFNTKGNFENNWIGEGGGEQELASDVWKRLIRTVNSYSPDSSDQITEDTDFNSDAITDDQITEYIQKFLFNLDRPIKNTDDTFKYPQDDTGLSPLDLFLYNDPEGINATQLEALL